MAHGYAVRVCGGVDQVVVTHMDHPFPTWKYCSRYHSRDGGQIPLAADKHPVSRELVTKWFTKQRPIYVEADQDSLLEAIETRLGPIGLLSYGPTAQDKKVLQLPI